MPLNAKWVIWLASLLISCWLTVPGYAASSIQIGVLAYRSKEVTYEHWRHLADALHQRIPQYEFFVQVYTPDELAAKVASRQLDFVLTNPANYVKLSRDSGLSAPLATLINNENLHLAHVFGGVVFTRSDQSKINHLEDVKSKTVAIVGNHSLGGYQMQAYELLRQGITLQEANLIKTGMPHDNVVNTVLSGKAAIGFVRTGVLEAMSREGRLDISQLKIINAQSLADFPLAVSTRLYPEWPFASMPHVHEDIARKVAAALFNLEENPAAVNAIGIHGFAVPADYTPVVDLMRELRLPPYDYVPSFNLQDVLTQYPWQIAALLLGLTLIVILSLRLLVAKRYLEFNHQALLTQKELLQDSQAELQAIFNTIPDLLFDMDSHGRYHAVHATEHSLLAAPALALVGKSVHEVLSPNAADIIMLALKEAEQTGFSQGKEIELSLPQGNHWFELSVAKKQSTDALSRFIVLSREVTARKLAEADLKIAATAFQSNEGILITDQHQVILRVNQSFTQITGYSADEVIGKTPTILHSGRQDKAFYQAMWNSIEKYGTYKGELWNRRKNGEIYPEYLVITAIRDTAGALTNYVATLSDITKVKAAAQEIENLAFYDALTGLPNRRLLIDRLTQALSQTVRIGKSGALLFLDLDHFKTLNDSLGHSFGDLLLQQVAERLSSAVREGDTVARLGGDEFVVMLENLNASHKEAAAQVESVALKILHALDQPYQIEAHEHHSTASIGATLFNNHVAGIDELLKQADIAMYQAKKAGRNTLRFFDPEMQASINTRAALEAELRKALERQQFKLYYQIQVDSSGYPFGAEVLIRWIHPERGLISPFHFIPLAEETGLILPIGDWVLNTACERLKIWQQDIRTEHFTLSVNVSAKQFRQPDFVSQVQAAIKRHDINPMCLKLELTESMLLEHMAQTIATMNALKEIGVCFSLDDFGTGYSSLQYLKKLPLYQLKIDQSFVRDIADDISDQAIVRTIIAMAQTLNLNVIAEGVETEQQRQLLEANGCSTYQGYLFSKPIPIEAFEVLLQQHLERMVSVGAGSNI
ncbi:MAG: EAL domain-containing protein [Methylotenera sp.]|nr:EAL domain-containing protein [Methylotenera sp.]